MSQYFERRPTVASDERTVELTLPDVTAVLRTDRGVFSADHVDVGTKYLLLEGPGPVDGDQVIVDLGCGYGPIARALAVRNPTATVWAIDVNERARALTVANTRDLGNVEVYAPDDAPDGPIDRIWSNPPIRIGKAALHELLRRWLTRLTPHGSAHLVVQKHLGADSLHRWLEAEGYGVERRGSRKAYRLLDVHPRSSEVAR